MLSLLRVVRVIIIDAVRKDEEGHEMRAWIGPNRPELPLQHKGSFKTESRKY